jgi:hypothetical protein
VPKVASIAGTAPVAARGGRFSGGVAWVIFQVVGSLRARGKIQRAAEAQDMSPDDCRVEEINCSTFQ